MSHWILKKHIPPTTKNANQTKEQSVTCLATLRSCFSDRASVGWRFNKYNWSQFSTNDTTTNMLQRFLISERSVSGDHIRTFETTLPRVIMSATLEKTQQGKRDMPHEIAWYATILFQPNCINDHKCTISTHESILESEVRQNPSHHHLASLRCCWVSLSSSASEISPGQATESESISTSKRSTNSRSMHNPTAVNKSLHPTGLWHMMIWCMMY